MNKALIPLLAASVLVGCAAAPRTDGPAPVESARGRGAPASAPPTKKESGVSVYAYHGPGTEQGASATPAAPEAGGGGGASTLQPPKPESPDASAATGGMAAGDESGFASAIAWKPPASLPTASKQAAPAASNPGNPAQATPPPAAQTSASKSGQGATAATPPNPGTAHATTSACTMTGSAPAAQTTTVASAAAPTPKPAAPIPEVKYAASAPPASKLPPAAASLAAQAEQQRQRGDYVAAAATLERAIRIQPRDSYLWNRLARVRLDQKNYSQAGSLAQKSNSLAKDEDRIKQDNWGMIGAARTAAGDQQGAKEAQAKAGNK